MATTIYFSDKLATTSRGQNNTDSQAQSRSWRSLGMLKARTGTNTQFTTNGVVGPTSPIDCGSTTLGYEWLSPPVDATVTISGTISISLYAGSNSSTTNATVGLKLFRVDSTGNVISTIASTTYGPELIIGSTGSWSTTPTATTLQPGDRIRAVPYWDDGNGVTMSTGTMQFYGGGIATTSSFVTFTEDVLFADASPSPLASGVLPNAAVYGITKAGSGYAICGAGGMVAVSSDGVSWSVGTSGTTNDLFSIAYQSGTYVAVGNAGTIVQSTDGSTWSTPSSGVLAVLKGVTYATSKFIACGAAGVILTSPDGATWTAQTSNTTVNLNAVASGGGAVIVVGNSGAVIRSTDGVTWTASTVGTTGNALNVVLYSTTESRWVALGSGGGFFHSLTGTGSWTSRTNSALYSLIQYGFLLRDGNLRFTNSSGSSWIVAGITGTVTADTLLTGVMYCGLYDATAEALYAGGFGTVYVDYAHPQTLYLTQTASDISDQGLTELKLWTARGSAATTAVRDTTAGYTAPLQWTDLSGGTALEWYTPKLNSVSLNEPIGVVAWVQSSSATPAATIRAEIAIVGGDGSSPTIWGAGNASPLLSTTNTRVFFSIAGPTTTIGGGQRLRLRLYVDDHEAAMATGNTMTVTYGATTALTSGDSYLEMPVVLTEYTGETAYPYIGGGYYGG